MVISLGLLCLGLNLIFKPKKKRAMNDGQEFGSGVIDDKGRDTALVPLLVISMRRILFMTVLM